MNEDSGSPELNQLGSGKTKIPASPDQAVLETFVNTQPGRDYRISFHCPEFTSLCPITGQPDFARIDITYVAGWRCIESKSLKLYLFSYRNEGSFSESIVNQILDDLVAVCEPRWMEVTGAFTPRGGIAITVTATYPDDAAHT